MRGFLLTLVILAVVVLMVVPYFILPLVLENMVARDVQDRLGLAERPGVELESDPQWEVLLGEFSSGRISVTEPDLGAMRADVVSMELDPFGVYVEEIVRSRTAVTEEPISAQVRLTVSEEEISRLAEHNAQVPVNGVELRGDGVTVESEASVLGVTFPVAVEGGVGLEGNALLFQPQIVRVAGMMVPTDLADSLLAGAAFRYPVEGLPYGGRLTGVKTLDGAVVLTGRVSGMELGG